MKNNTAVSLAQASNSCVDILVKLQNAYRNDIAITEEDFNKIYADIRQLESNVNFAFKIEFE